ncbi:hypothetical protein Tco_0737725 [Tanacetum coccineum]
MEILMPSPRPVNQCLIKIVGIKSLLEITTVKISLLEDMDLESAHMVAASKVPMLKLENGNSAPKTIVVDGVEKFNSIKDAKSLLEAIEERFRGNVATKKTQRNLLKEQYENFFAPSSETLDQTFDRLQKLVSQLEILGEKLSQEDVNRKLLRSFSRMTA